MKYWTLTITILLSSWSFANSKLAGLAPSKKSVSTQSKQAAAGGRIERGQDKVLVLHLSGGKKLFIYDSGIPKNIESISAEKRTGSGGGWQPESKQVQVEALALEIIRMAAQENCSAQSIADALEEAFSGTAENLIFDISLLPAEIKLCFER